MRIILSIYVLLFLLACGFKPVLAKDQQASLSGIMLLEVEGDEKEKLQYNIAKALNFDSKNPIKYYLKLKITQNLLSLGVMKDTQTTRQRVSITLDYELLRASDNMVVDKSSLSLYGGYDVAGSEFSNYVSANYTGDNVIKELCVQLKNRLRMALADQE